MFIITTNFLKSIKLINDEIIQIEVNKINHVPNNNKFFKTNKANKLRNSIVLVIKNI